MNLFFSSDHLFFSILIWVTFSFTSSLLLGNFSLPSRFSGVTGALRARSRYWATPLGGGRGTL